MNLDRTILLKALLLLAGLVCFGAPHTAAAQPAACLAETSLDAFVGCVKGYMPDEGSEGYAVPTGAELDAWRGVVAEMMALPCASVALPQALQGAFTVAAFTDAGRGYCVLAETNDLDFSIVPTPPANWITSPNGGETWQRASTVTVEWDADGTAAPVKLALLKDGAFSKYITNGTPNTGSFAWFVPPTLEAGSTYTVRVRNAEDEDLQDFSDAPFTIADGPNSQVITVISPNGGEAWARGSTQAIVWSAPNVDTTLTLALFRNGEFYKNIKTVPNTGSYAWKIPSSWTPEDTLTVRIRSSEHTDVVDYSDGLFQITASAAAAVAVPAAAALVLDNYPNPFNPVTTIRFTLPAATEVSLTVFDLLGRRVATLAEGPHAAGAHEVRFDAATLPSGLYLYRIEADGRAEVRRMLLMK